MIVSEIPGTTRDSIDTVLERGGRTFVLVDTAGLRRKRRHRQGIEYYSELRALEAAERADVALVLIDASQGVVDQDLAVADISRKADCSTLVVLSKWDTTTVRIEDVRGHLRRRLRQRPPFLAVSAQTGRGLNRLLDSVAELFDRHTARVPTRELNRVLGELREGGQPPSRKGKSLNLLYGTQIRVRPPRFRFFVNDPEPRHARLRLLGRERAARALRPRRRPGLDRLRAQVVDQLPCGSSSSARDPGARPSRACCSTAGTRSCSPATRRSRRDAIAATGRNPALLTQIDLRGVAAVALADAPGDVDAIVLAVPSTAFADGRRGLPGDAPVLSLTKGLDPATGERLSTRVRGRAVAVLSGPNMAEEIALGLPTAAVIASEDGFLAGQLQHAVNSTVFRAYVNPDVVGVELCAAAKNVIGARRGRRRRARPRRQRQGGADHARPRRDGAARRGVRRAPRDVRGPGRHGRPDRHLLEPPRPQPPRGRADRPGDEPRAGDRRDRPDRRGDHDGARPPGALPAGRRGITDHGGRLRGTLRAEPHRIESQVDGPAADRGVNDALG